MYYTINDNNEINGFYPDDYTSLPASAVQCTEADRDRAIAYQSQGLVMCVTNGVISGEKRPDAYSVWSSTGKWVVSPELKNKSILNDIAKIDAQIIDLEASQTRQLRELLLNVDDGTAKTKLQESNAQITELRTQRATLSAQLQ